MVSWNEDPTDEVAHRPWPLPREPWIMAQRWNRLLFAHWQVSADEVRPLIPKPLSLQLHGNAAWVTISPFYLSHLRPRGVPAVPWVSEFPELNVRTYVMYENVPGVYFFSLDAGSVVGVAAARALYHLPYFRAAMTLQNGNDNAVSYRSHRTHTGAPAADFQARYRSTGKPLPAEPGSLDHWLTERYCLYAVEDGAVYRAEIHHRPWRLQPAEAEISLNTMGLANGITLPPGPQRISYTQQLDVVVWRPKKVA
jgi:uncharacterized protein